MNVETNIQSGEEDEVQRIWRSPSSEFYKLNIDYKSKKNVMESSIALNANTTSEITKEKGRSCSQRA